MKHISSVHNPEIKKLVKLHTSHGRKQYQQFIAEGKRVLDTIFQSHLKLVQIYATEDHLQDIEKLKINKKSITVITEPIARKASSMKTPSGIIGVFYIPDTPAWDTLTSGIVLAQISDPGNMGTLIRTATAAQLKSIVIIDNSTDPWSPKVIQASAGTISHISIFQCSWQELVNNKQSLKLYGLVVKDGKNISSVSPNNSLLVVGNEAHGLPQTWQESCDALVSLPMPGNTESLNAGIAGSIALYITHVYFSQTACYT